jgi:hypothetical protein
MTDQKNSITLHPRQLTGVEIAVAEQFLAHPRTLHEEADVELVGHAHAASNPVHAAAEVAIIPDRVYSQERQRL